ncbi:MAG: DUF4097 domain-containing protein [Ruminococcaceae bacterium]|nr:DUF4097 domain-containing protein [Oscillospiraceae bacterium]
MSKKTKIWLVTAFSLTLIGCIIFAGVMTLLKWDFTKLSTEKLETNNYEISGNYKDISITTDTADVTFEICNETKTSVKCFEPKNIKHLVSVKDGTLMIKVIDNRKWYEYIGIFSGSPKITVYIPQGEYGALKLCGSTGDVKIPKNLKFENIDISQSTGNVTNFASATKSINIKTSTGDILTQNIFANSLKLSVSTGKITAYNISGSDTFEFNVSTGKTQITDIKCKNLISSGNTGNITMKNVIATEKFSVKRTTGKVRFENCDASEIFMETDTGNVIGSLLSDKVFITNTDTGNINVPKTTIGGKCEITTDTGDIKITVN